MSNSDPISIKLVIVGDGAIGKTCILVSYTQNKFPTEYEPTVFDNFSTNLKVDDKIVNLGIWDTAGQEQYNRLRPLAYPSCDVFLICFSVIDPNSFVNARNKWYPEIDAIVPNAAKIFVGNKIDLREKVSMEDKDPKKAPIVKQTARKIIEEEMKCQYIECSALTQEGLSDLFNEAVRAVIKKKGKGKQMSQKSGSSCNICQLI